MSEVVVEKKKKGVLHEEAAKLYNTSIVGWQGQKHKCVLTGTTFQLETVPVASIEAMIKKGSKAFSKKEKAAVAPAAAK